MPNILTLENVSKSFENRLLLDSVTAGINSDDRLGVIGVNGTGKSTLLAIIAGTLEPDEGQVIRSNGLRISFLPQNPEFDSSRTVLENVCGAISGKHEYWDTTGEARAMLERLGIPEPDRKPDTLSGGQRKRAALAAALLTPADLLILDEPTNHLDSAMIEWLQDFLSRYRGALLMVTHDRYFLDQVTTGILEIDRGKLYRYAENYSGYLERKAERMNAAIAAERKAQALYKKDLAWILRGARARSTKQKAHIQRFEALRDREKPIEEVELQMASVSSRLGGKTIELDHVAAGYDGKPLFRDFSYIFLKNDRIGIIGPNGCGKSTLIKTITGELQPLEGTVEIGQTVKIGCFSQENELPDGEERVIDCVRDVAEFIRTPDGYVSAANMCEQFLFDGNMQYTPVRKLSGGEKRRLYLLRVLMSAPNVLILDEPTNDLDIQTLRVLEDYLDRFAGIVIAVSHDRYFLDRVVRRIFSFEGDGVLHQNEGGYEEYRERKLAEGSAADEAAGFGAVGQRRKNAGGDSPEGTASAAGTEGRGGRGDGRAHAKKKTLSYKDQREYDGIEAEIDALQAESDRLAKEVLAAASDYITLAKVSAEKEAVDEKLEERMERYLELQEMVDALNAQE